MVKNPSVNGYVGSIPELGKLEKEMETHQHCLGILAGNTWTEDSEATVQRAKELNTT